MQDRRRDDLLRDERARRIHDRLLVLGDALASFYLRVLDELAAEPTRPAARKVIFHAWRELEGGLRDVLAPMVPASADADTHEKKIAAVLDTLEIGRDEAVARTWFGLVGRPHREAHRSGAQDAGALDAELRSDWDAFEDVLDRVLERFQERYLAAVSAVPRLLMTARPSEADLSAVLWLPQPARDQFFRDLTRDGWLVGLVEKRFLTRPVPRAYASDGSFTLPYWQPAGYLQRLAQRRSERLQRAVMEIVLATEETDNDIAHMTMTEIALLAPPLFAAAWAEREAAWVARQTWLHPLLSERLSQLAATLADAGALESARPLAAALLEPLRDPRYDTGERAIALAREPRSRLGEDFDYEHALGIVVPGLERALGREMIGVVAGLLTKAIELARVVDSADGRDDLSTWWRPTIEDTDQTHRQGLRQTLVEQLRDVAARVATADPSAIPQIVADLEARGLAIFQRIALHVLRVVADAPVELVASHILDPRARRPACWHEWALLVHDRFGDLSSEQRDTLIALFFAGPDENREIARFEQIEGRAPTAEEIEARLDHARMRYLQLIAEQLPPEARERYETLRAARGEVERPDLLHFSSRLASPPVAAEIRTFGSDVNAWVTFARSYTPGPRILEDGHEVASRVLAAAVKDDPATFAAAAARFADLRPPYVRAVFNGLEEAARAGTAVAWPEVLSLAEWVLAQPFVAQPEASFDEVGWTWTYHGVAHLLRWALLEGPLQIALDQRERIFGIIAQLAAIGDPTAEQEARRGDGPRRLDSLALATTRPRAIALAIDYGLWLDRRIGPADPAAVRTFAETPELAALLVAHLDPAGEPSAAVRSIYGERLGSLLYLDRAWLEQHRAAIFPTEPAVAPLHAAAWEAYLDGNNVSRHGFEALRAEYARAVEAIDQPSEYGWTTPPAATVLQHLLVLTAVNIEGAAPLLDAALTRAPSTVRHGAFELFGRALRRWIPEPSVARRIEALFETRIEAATRSADRASFASELATIGLWCDVPAGLDDAWLLGAVERVLRLTGEIDGPHWVTRRIARDVGPHPEAAIAALDALVSAFGAKTWRLDSWMRDITVIITTAYRAGGEHRERARAVANRLALVGYTEQMRALLAELDAPADDAAGATVATPDASQ